MKCFVLQRFVCFHFELLIASLGFSSVRARLFFEPLEERSAASGEPGIFFISFPDDIHALLRPSFCLTFSFRLFSFQPPGFASLKIPESRCFESQLAKFLADPSMTSCWEATGLRSQSDPKATCRVRLGELRIGASYFSPVFPREMNSFPATRRLTYN